MPAALLHVDSRKRITLPPEASIAAGDDLEIEVMPNGCIMLTPIVRVPKAEAIRQAQYQAEICSMLADYLRDDTPLTDMSKPGNLDALRSRVMGNFGKK